MSGTIGRFALFVSLTLSLVLVGRPAVADPTPSHSVTKSCEDNRITVVEITLADYPPGSTASIEGDPIPVNATTIVWITRPIVLEVDSSGYEGDFEQTIRPRPVCRLFI